MASTSGHVPVLLRAAVASLMVKPEGRYVDCTYGRGGHSGYLLSQLGEAGELLALDRDPQAVADGLERFEKDRRFQIRAANFGDLSEVLESLGWQGTVDGVLLDLGVSSPQLDQASRGFAFAADGELDMRMDPTQGLSAADWLATVGVAELVRVLKTYGEERYAKRIASAIVEARATAHITRTMQLAEIIKAAHPRWERHHHPATRSFQAIRIAVNGELDALDHVLDSAADALKPAGRIAVISFHSLEDRIVKRRFRPPQRPADLPRHLPLPESVATKIQAHPWRAIGKPVKANAEELADNPRARSATLRVAERHEWVEAA